jgi:hypothetical protein
MSFLRVIIRSPCLVLIFLTIIRVLFLQSKPSSLDNVNKPNVNSEKTNSMYFSSKSAAWLMKMQFDTETLEKVLYLEPLAFMLKFNFLTLR